MSTRADVLISLICGVISGVFVWILDAAVLRSAYPASWIVGATALAMATLALALGRRRRRRARIPPKRHQPVDGKEKYYRYYYGLFEGDRARYDRVRERLGALRIAADGEHSPEQLANVDRLLWIYLGMLARAGHLRRFVTAERADDVVAALRRATARLSKSGRSRRNPIVRMKRRCLALAVVNARRRRDNFREAEVRCDWIELEASRLEEAMLGLSEFADTHTASNTVIEARTAVMLADAVRIEETMCSLDRAVYTTADQVHRTARAGNETPRSYVEAA